MGTHSYQRSRNEDGTEKYVVGKGQADKFEPIQSFPSEGEAMLQVKHLDEQEQREKEDAKHGKQHDQAEKRQPHEARSSTSEDPEADEKRPASRPQAHHTAARR